jgi:hypothetical protein
MPNRILYEKICVSDTLAELEPEAERFFYRLLVQCDDYGRFDARPAVLLGRCFPLMLHRVGEGDVAAWLERLQAVGLVALYSVDGHPYLQVATWATYQRMRAKHSKFPGPETPIRGHSRADARDGGPTPRIRETRNEKRETDPDAYSDAEGGAAAAAAGPPAPSAAGPTPPELSGFDQILRGLPGYEPDEAFYGVVARKYAAPLDLEEEAAKMAGRAREEGGLKGWPTGRILNWLANSRPNEHGPGAVNGTVPASPTGNGPAPAADMADEVADLPPEPEPAAAELWGRVSDRVQGDMTRANFETYLASCSGLAVRDGELLVAVPNPFQLEGAGRFLPHMRRALEDLGAAPRDVRLVVGG